MLVREAQIDEGSLHIFNLNDSLGNIIAKDIVELSAFDMNE